MGLRTGIVHDKATVVPREGRRERDGHDGRPGTARLFVAGRDRTALATAARRQQVLVAEALGAGPLVRAALCFTGVERAPFTRPFLVQEVLVTWPKALARSVAAPGCSGLPRRVRWRIGSPGPFRPIRVDYAPGGTSHRPTGASPRG
jgi:hypothetical protein